MTDIQDPEGSRSPTTGPAAPETVDLAFSAAERLSPELLQAGGVWLDPLEAAEAWQTLLAQWWGQLLPELPPTLQSDACSLGLSLVDDAEISALNRDWRHLEGPTDVLAFAAQDDGLDEAPPMPMPVTEGEPDDDGSGWHGEPLELGDIVISVETAARQAPEHGNDLGRELLFLASHGLLHLLGWDHPDETSLAAMLQRQQALLDDLPTG